MVKLNKLTEVLEMDVYSNEGKQQLNELANIIDKLGDVCTPEQMNLLYELLMNGHVLETCDMIKEKLIDRL